MKKTCVFLSIFFIFNCVKPRIINKDEVAQTIHTSFAKTYGGSKNESAQSIVSTSDGGYLILGYTQSNDGDIIDAKTEIQYDFWLLKFDSNDQLEWQKTIGGAKDDKGYKIITTSDNGFLLIGSGKSDYIENQGFEDIWAIKIDSLGNVLWGKSFGYAGMDVGYAGIETSDGGFLVTGLLDVSASGGEGKSAQFQRHAGGDYWAIKLSNQGDIIWKNYFGGSNTDTCYDVVETEDGFLLVGSSDSEDVDVTNNKGSYDIWLVKLDLNGHLIWEKSLGGREIDAAHTILKTNDNHFLLVGETRSSDADITQQHGGADMWILKITNQGQVLWQKTYGGTNFDLAKSAVQSSDGNFLIVGNSRSNDEDVTENHGQNDVWILKINQSGRLLWEKSIGGSDIDLGLDLIELDNGNIIIVGESNSNDFDISENKGFTDALIIKLEP